MAHAFSLISLARLDVPAASKTKTKTAFDGRFVAFDSGLSFEQAAAAFDSQRSGPVRVPEQAAAAGAFVLLTAGKYSTASLPDADLGVPARVVWLSRA